MNFTTHYRPQPTDDLQTIIAGFSEGNPGAMTVMVDLYRVTHQRSPLLFGTFILMLEQLRLYGPGIYMLWNDCLDRNIACLVRLIVAWRNDEIFNDEIIRHVNVEGGRGIPFETLINRRPWII